MKITDNIYMVPDVVANTFLIVDSDGLTLIDAGLPGMEKKILHFVASLGWTAHDIKRILLTHADWDHIGSLAALHKASGARTFASRIEAQAIAAGKPSRPAAKPASLSLFRRLMRLLMQPKPFVVDEILELGQILPVGGGLRVIDSSGHCPGHISFFAPSAGILFCGDSIVSDAHGLHGSFPGYTADEARAKQAVREQAALGASIVCSGHGPVVMDAEGKFPL